MKTLGEHNRIDKTQITLNEDARRVYCLFSFIEDTFPPGRFLLGGNEEANYVE